MDSSQEIQKYVDEGRNLVNNGQVEGAVLLYEEAAEYAEEQGDKKMAGYFWQQRGVAHNIAGKTEAAIGDFDRAVGVMRDVGDMAGVGNVLRDKGVAETAAGKLTEAIVDLKESIRLLEKENPNWLGVSMAKLGKAYLAKGDKKLARKWLEEGLETVRKDGDWFMEMTTLLNLAELNFTDKKYSEMIDELWAGIGLICDKGDQDVQKKRLAEIYALLSRGYEATGAKDRALELRTKAETYLAEMPAEVAEKVRKDYFSS